MDKDLKKIIKALEKQGFEVEVTAKGHVTVYHDDRLIVTFSGTPSDWRSVKNGIAAARRAGFRWPPTR
jgi:predicted RNA binding protein YcfA (HicA-like mRNA interferase family)